MLINKINLLVLLKEFESLFIMANNIMNTREETNKSSPAMDNMPQAIIAFLYVK